MAEELVSKESMTHDWFNEETNGWGGWEIDNLETDDWEIGEWVTGRWRSSEWGN